MKVKDKHWITLFLLLSLWGSVVGQSLEQTYQLGKKAYEEGDYKQAISYYNRVLFFDQQQAYTRFIFEDMAESHYQLSEYESSAYFYDLAYNMEREAASAKNELLLKRALCYIYMEEFNSALLDLYLIEDAQPAIQRQASLLEGMCLYRLNKFDQAETAFLNALKNSRDSVIVLQSYKELDKINRKSPKKAKIFSMILPGSGLIYVGDWKNGTSSLVLVGGLASLMVVSTVNTGFVNAFLNVFPWYQRYFMGGFQLTEEVAREKLDTRRLRHLQKTLHKITSTY